MRNETNSSTFQCFRLGLASLLVAAVLWSMNTVKADASYKPFTGEKSAWHDGFDRYDFLMDEETLAIAPGKPPEKQTYGIGATAKGQRRCIVIVPKTVAPGNPWSWRGCYWDHEPQTEIELLRRGFHIAYITADASLRPDKKWDSWHAFLTEQHGLSSKPAFIGMSRGGEYSYTWATAHPDKVSCIYADNPGGNDEVLTKLQDLAKRNVPLLHVCGSIDPILERFSTTIENIYQQFGGRISVVLKDGAGHHPHSLRDPKLIADFIERSVQDGLETVPPPAYAGSKFIKSHYYALENSYRDFPREGGFMTCRGPLFTPCYDRYDAWLGFDFAITIITPKTEASGKPWVFRAGYVARDAVVDQALLAKGYHIVVGPVPFNADGPSLLRWDALYKHFTAHGFSKKPVMQGEGGAAGAVYAWAVANPDKVSCVYAENPILINLMTKEPLLDRLAPLAKAGVPLLHVCGSLDPRFNEQTKTMEKKYQELGGKITVIVKEGEGHYPLAPKDPQGIVDLIVNNTK